MTKPQNFGTTALATISLLAITSYTASASIATPSRVRVAGSAVSAHVSRTLKATDEARMHFVKHRSSSSRLFEEGTAHGTLPGSMNAYCSLGATFSASFTIYTDGGTIDGHGTATPHAGGGLYESFAGTLTVTGGTGRYVHAHGHAGLYGAFNRRTYALTVQTTGSLSY
jgi:hypothetical protein